MNAKAAEIVQCAKAAAYVAYLKESPTQPSAVVIHTFAKKDVMMKWPDERKHGAGYNGEGPRRDAPPDDGVTMVAQQYSR